MKKKIQIIFIKTESLERIDTNRRCRVLCGVQDRRAGRVLVRRAALIRSPIRKCRYFSSGCCCRWWWSLIAHCRSRGSYLSLVALDRPCYSTRDCFANAVLVSKRDRRDEKNPSSPPQSYYPPWSRYRIRSRSTFDPSRSRVHGKSLTLQREVRVVRSSCRLVEHRSSNASGSRSYTLRKSSRRSSRTPVNFYVLHNPRWRRYYYRWSTTVLLLDNNNCHML